MATCGVDRGDPKKLKIALRVGEPFCGTQACGGGAVLGDPELGVAGAEPQVSLTSPQTVSQLQHLEPPLGL